MPISVGATGRSPLLSFLPMSRVTLDVEDCQDGDARLLINEEDRIRKTVNERAAGGFEYQGKS